MKLLCLLVALLIAATGIARADEWEKLRQMPGAVVAPPAVDGTGLERIILPSGVSFTRYHENGEDYLIGTDESGHGAVMCAWEYYVELAAEVRACRPGTELEAELRRAVGRIDDFIVANSVSGETKEDSQQYASQHEADFLRQMPKDELARRCSSSDLAPTLDRLDSTSLDKLHKNIDDLLAIPRPAVMNPCP